MLICLGILTYVTILYAALPTKFIVNDYETLQFDRSVPEYETVLTPSDFELGAEIIENLRQVEENGDSDAMYEKTRFEGDIANENASFLLRSLIAASMQEYSTYTCIQWVPKTNNDVNYVYIFPDRGCYSMVGKIGGKQSLSLGSGCIQKGIIIHELMHAVGFFHEQSRTDRDDFITILWNNIQPGMQGQFEKYGQGTIQSLGTTYDYASIMHYGGKAFSRNGQPTMVPKQKGAQIGQRSGFSKTDIYKINKLYGCPTDEKPETTTEPVQTTTVSTSTPTSTRTTGTSSTSFRTIQPIQPSPVTLPVITTECKNLRGDCDELGRQGWCERNPAWMKVYCPIPCGFCEKKPTTPTMPARPPTTPLPPSDCEDLRVDCLVLVQQRYCKLSQNFMKTYCAKSCGFCFKPPPVEGSTALPTLVTNQPLVTMWRTSTTPTVMTASPTFTTAPPTQECKDRKHFCSHWKTAGFCEGIFMNYMKRNCPSSCGLC
ncbi:shTK domain protein [Oesophagostomum dentatum]|uniref:Metalloendopeptidase n=1 Tax=Oesophagostomum dentatum TaxID=61180 RepID=A0A0B1TAZ7_OESDE|nr:shTK domain protein [Oesophagostomum dentatum]